MPIMRSIERFRPPKPQAAQSSSSSGDLQRRSSAAVRLIPGDPDQDEIGNIEQVDLTLSLPPELLHLIASKLTNICDYIRFRSVCTRWRRIISSATATATAGGGGGRQHPRWLPWLILPLTAEGDFLPIFNTADCRFYNLPLPEEVRGGGPSNYVRGSAHGWLVIVDPHPYPLMKASLYNPITRAHILLPPIPFGSAYTILLCCNPTTASPRQLLLSITMAGSKPMLIYRQGDARWTPIKMPPSFIFSTHLTYVEEEATIYVATADGLLAVLDLTSLTFRILISSRSREINSLIAPWNLVASAGDLLFVASNGLRAPPAPSIFKIFKLERDKEGCLKWARTATIGDCTLFMVKTESVAVMSDQGSFNRQANLIYQFENFHDPVRDKNAAVIKGRIQVRELITGDKLCLEITSKRIKYTNRLLHTFTWMVPNMS